MPKFVTRVAIDIYSDAILAKPEKLQKAEAFVDAALTAGFNLLGTFTKYDVTGVDVSASVSEKIDDGGVGDA